MKNLSIRLILAGLVTGFTYLAFLSSNPDTAHKHNMPSSLSFSHLLSQSMDENHLHDSAHEEHIRKLNYAQFRRSLLKHRTIYYANED